MRIVRALAVTLLALSAQAMPVADYIQHLQSIDAALRANRTAEARDEAGALKGITIEAPGGNFTADASLLDAILADRAGAQTRIAVAVAELRKANPGAAPATDPKLLETLRREESGGDLKKGGEVPQPPISTEPAFIRFVEALDKALEWIVQKLEDFGEWLRQFWPKSTEASDSNATLKTRSVVAALVIAILIVIGVLAWEVIRRSKRAVAAPVTASEPVASKRDENPLSRGASEWERYAAQLAAAGRVREAIRAWYHAVLVTCYGAGILHFRKGRTNWEYVSAVSPQHEWRGEFVRLTRRFEEEWYGRDTSSRAAYEECAAHGKRILDAIHSAHGVAA